MAHIVIFTKIFENQAFGELQILSRNLAMKPNWNCFYSAIWQKIIDDTFKGNFIQDLSEVGIVLSSKHGDNSSADGVPGAALGPVQTEDLSEAGTVLSSNQVGERLCERKGD